MLHHIIGAVLQVLAFALIPFIWHLIQNKSAKGFFAFVGLHSANPKANLLGLSLSLLFAFPVLIFTNFNSEFAAILTNPESVSGQMREMGLSASTLVIIAVVAIVKTGLSEELFFRGFVAKRLIAWLGFGTGNLLHAALFGIIHSLLFMTITDNWLFITVIFVFPTAGAYLSVYINEKLANGSIIPGWIAHASANVLSYSFVAFYL